MKRLSRVGRAPVPEWEELARAASTPPKVFGWFAAHLLALLVVTHAGLLIAFLWRSPLWAAAFWVLASACDWAGTRADSASGRLLTLAGLKPQLRAALRTILVVGTFLTAPVLGYVVAVLVLQVVWSCREALMTWLSRSAPPLRYRPADGSQPRPLADYARCYASAVGTPGGMVLAELLALAGLVLPIMDAGRQATWPLPVAGALLAAGLGVRTALAARGLLGSRAAATQALLAELSADAPVYLAYVSLGAGQARYIANQWLPVFDATPSNGIVLVREASQLRPLAATRLPVVYAPTTRDVELLALPGVKVAFYLAYGEKNAHLLRDPRLKHVMLLHGDSDKATSANAQARAFDQVWVAGRAAVERYLAAGVQLAEDRFVLIGRPQVEPLLDAPPRDPSEPPVVLYAPTFEGYYEQTAHSSLDSMGPAMVRRLLEDFPDVRIWFKPHPASGVVRQSMLTAISEIEGLLAGGGHVLVDHTGLTLTDCLARADVLLADVSSVTSDFLATGRPAVITNPAGLPLEEFLAAYPSQRGLYIVGPDLTDFDAALAAALGPDPLRAERLALRSHLLGEVRPQAAFDAALARLAGTGSAAGTAAEAEGRHG